MERHDGSCIQVYGEADERIKSPRVLVGTVIVSCACAPRGRRQVQGTWRLLVSIPCALGEKNFLSTMALHMARIHLDAHICTTPSDLYQKGVARVTQLQAMDVFGIAYSRAFGGNMESRIPVSLCLCCGRNRDCRMAMSNNTGRSAEL